MPPKKGGKRTKRAKKSTATDTTTKYTPYAADGQVYAVATKMLGNRRLMVKCMDGQEKLAHIPGRFKGRRNWIEVGMVVLINEMEFRQDNKVDIIYIYDAQDVRRLQRSNELGNLLGAEEAEEQDTGFVFGSEEDEAVVIKILLDLFGDDIYMIEGIERPVAN